MERRELHIEESEIHYVCQYHDFTSSPTFSPSFAPSPVPTFQPTGPTGQPSGQPTSNPTTSSPTSYMKRSCAVGAVAFDCREQNSVCLESECACSPGYYFDGADGGKCVESPGGYIPLASQRLLLCEAGWASIATPSVSLLLALFVPTCFFLTQLAHT